MPNSSTTEPKAHPSAPAPVREVTCDGTRSNPSSESIDTLSLPPQEQCNPNYITSVLRPEDIASLKGMDHVFTATTSMDHVGEHLNTLAYACAVGSPSYNGGPKRNEEAIKIPPTYKEVMASPQAKEEKMFIDKKMCILQPHQVLGMVSIKSVPADKNVIGSNFVFKQKDTSLYKSRLVVQAYAPEPGRSHRATFTPVCRIGSKRVMLAIVGNYRWPVLLVDFRQKSRTTCTSRQLQGDMSGMRTERSYVKA